MDSQKFKIAGSSTLSPVANKKRKEISIDQSSASYDIHFLVQDTYL